MPQSTGKVIFVEIVNLYGLWILSELFSINFNHESSLICVSSDHGTVHIFAVEDAKRNKQSRSV